MPQAPKDYYECHITMEGDAQKVESVCQAIRWTFSAIDNDIVLGKGTKLYATRHFKASMPRAHVIHLLDEAVRVVRECNIVVLRKKVELVVHDVKFDT